MASSSLPHATQDPNFESMRSQEQDPAESLSPLEREVLDEYAILLDNLNKVGL